MSLTDHDTLGMGRRRRAGDLHGWLPSGVELTCPGASPPLTRRRGSCCGVFPDTDGCSEVREIRVDRRSDRSGAAHVDDDRTARNLGIHVDEAKVLARADGAVVGRTSRPNSSRWVWSRPSSKPSTTGLATAHPQTWNASTDLAEASARARRRRLLLWRTPCTTVWTQPTCSTCSANWALKRWRPSTAIHRCVPRWVARCGGARIVGHGRIGPPRIEHHP